MAEDRNVYKIHDNGSLGEVQIADEVVAIIAGLAATEVEGVDSMAGNITNELVGKLGMKNLSKGVKVDVLEDVVCVDLALNIKYGYNILETSKTVQERVKAAIENMTGLTVSDVNVRIASVEIEKTSSSSISVVIIEIRFPLSLPSSFAGQSFRRAAKTLWRMIASSLKAIKWLQYCSA